MMPSTTRAVPAWPCFATAYPAAASAATMMSRTNSTKGPLGGFRGFRSSLTVKRCPSRGPLARMSLRSVRLVQNLLDHALGLLLVGVGGEHQLRDEDLPGLREHALLACRQALLTLADGEVS